MHWVSRKSEPQRLSTPEETTSWFSINNYSKASDYENKLQFSGVWKDKKEKILKIGLSPLLEIRLYVDDTNVTQEI